MKMDENGFMVDDEVKEANNLFPWERHKLRERTPEPKTNDEIMSLIQKKKQELTKDEHNEVYLTLDFEWLSVLKVVEKLQANNLLPAKLYNYDKNTQSYIENDNYAMAVFNIQKHNLLNEAKDLLTKNIKNNILS